MTILSSIYLLFQTTLLVLASADSSSNPWPPVYARSDEEPLRPQQSRDLLQDVLEAITLRRSWKMEDIRVVKLDTSNVRFGNLRSYDFRLHAGKTDLIFRFSDEMTSWKRPKTGRRDIETLVSEVDSVAVLDVFVLEGPFELRVAGDDELSLKLPLQHNSSYAGLKRIVIPKGITVEVRGAREVSFFYSFDLGLPGNNRSVPAKKDRSKIWPFWVSLCMPLVSMQISGSPSASAYRSRSRNAHIEIVSLSKRAIELLPEKCYEQSFYRKQACPFDLIGSRITLLEKLFRSFLGERVRHKGLFGSLKAQIRAVPVFRFQLELETSSGGREEEGVPGWRSRPSVRRFWFDVVARLESERLTPVSIRRVQPFVKADSAAWSSLMSNISFTKFPPIFVPPEPLTLD